MKEKKRVEKLIKELILKDDELLELTTAIEGPIGFENINKYRLSVNLKGRLIIEKMTPGGWRLIH